MGYTKEAEKYYRSLIKRLVIIKPELRHNAWGVKKELERLSETSVKLHQDTIAKYLRKIHREIEENFTRQKARDFVRDYQGLVSEIAPILMSIVFSSHHAPMERIAAARELRAGYNDIFDKLISSGIFEGQAEKGEGAPPVSLQEKVSAPQKILGILRVMREMGHITDKEILEITGIKTVGELGKGVNGNGTKPLETNDEDYDTV